MTTDREFLGPELHKPVTHSVLVDAGNLYLRHFRLFASVVVLPSLAGTFLFALSRTAISRLAQDLPADPYFRLRAMERTHIVLEAGLINTIGFLGLWLCWAFAFAAVTSAVRSILLGDEADAEDCFNSVRERPGRFVVASGYLFLKILILSYIVGLVVFLWSSTVAGHFKLEIHPYVVALVILLIIASLTLPFLLAIPLAALEDRGLVASLKRSFKLTEGKSLVMLGLFLETELSAYLISGILNWIVYRGFSGQGIPILYGGAFYLEILVSAFFQPIAMIGFAWIYATRAHELEAQEAEHIKHAVSDSVTDV